MTNRIFRRSNSASKYTPPILTNPIYGLVIVSLLIATVGTMILLYTRAATSIANFEAERANITSPALSVNDVTASNGQAIQFGVSSTQNFLSHALYIKASALTQVVTGQRPSSLNSLSGLTASKIHSNVYWTHNDSGSGAQIFAINQNGSLLATRSFNAGSLGAQDYEDISVGPGPENGASYIYLAAVGDNGENRGFITIYRMKEPASITGTMISADRIDIKYPDGAKNCESFFVDPANGDWYLFEKNTSGATARVYRLAAKNIAANSSAAQTSNILTKLAVTLQNHPSLRAASIAPDRGAFILRKGHENFIYKISGASTTISEALQTPYVRSPSEVVDQAQVEAVAFSADSTSFIVASEQEQYRAVIRFNAP